MISYAASNSIDPYSVAAAVVAHPVADASVDTSAVSRARTRSSRFVPCVHFMRDVTAAYYNAPSL